MLGGRPIALAEIFQFQQVSRDGHAVNVMCRWSLGMAGERDRIRRIMEVDASVLLESCSLQRRGRANDRREIGLAPPHIHGASLSAPLR